MKQNNIQCTTCGHENRPDAKFCENCGCAIDSVDSVAPSEEIAVSQKRNWFKTSVPYLIILVAVLAFVVIALIIALNANKVGEADSVTETQVPPTVAATQNALVPTETVQATQPALAPTETTAVQPAILNLSVYAGNWNVQGAVSGISEDGSGRSTASSIMNTELVIGEINDNSIKFDLWYRGFRPMRNISAQASVDNDGSFTAPFEYTNGEDVLKGTLSFNSGAIGLNITESSIDYAQGSLVFTEKHREAEMDYTFTHKLLPDVKIKTYTKEAVLKRMQIWEDAGFSLYQSINLAKNEMCVNYGVIFNDAGGDLQNYFYVERSNLYGAGGNLPGSRANIDIMEGQDEKNNMRLLVEMNNEYKDE